MEKKTEKKKQGSLRNVANALFTHISQLASGAVSVVRSGVCLCDFLICDFYSWILSKLSLLLLVFPMSPTPASNEKLDTLNSWIFHKYQWSSCSLTMSDTWYCVRLRLSSSCQQTHRGSWTHSHSGSRLRDH